MAEMLEEENPYTPPASAPDTISKRPHPKAAGGLTRALAALVLMFFVPTIIGVAWTARSFNDYINVVFLSLFAFEFAHITFTGKLYPTSLNT